MRELIEILDTVLLYVLGGTIVASVGGVALALREHYKDPVVSKMHIKIYKDGTKRDSQGREVRVEYIERESILENVSEESR